MSITFTDPPLNEVSIGRTFLPRPDFLVPHFGAFWERIRSEFPKVDHAAPILTQGEDAIDLGQYMLPRVWFLSDDSARLLQLQQNRFHYNWRQTPDLATYVRFPAIQQVAIRLWDEFSTYVEKETAQPLVPLVNELTYTNLIDAEEDESGFDIGRRTLRNIGWSHANSFLPHPSQLSQGYTFGAPGDVGELVVAIVTGLRPDKRPVMKFDLTVRGKAPKGVGLEEWSRLAHDYLVAAFRDLTTPLMHAKWGLKEDANE
jgi:uncharacterized protein (TIGR04255 family)